MFSSLLSKTPDVLAALPAACKGFFGIPPWYKYLKLDDKCQVIDFNVLGNGTNSGLLLVGLAIIDLLLRIAGIVAVAFVLYGGFSYITSQAEPDKIAQAKHTIINALIGLVLAILATSIVVFIGNRLAP